MSRPWRNRARWAGAAVLAVALVVPATDGIAAGTDASAVTAELVGKWSRNVTAAVRVGGFAKRSVWSIVIGKFQGTDVIDIYAPGDTVGYPTFAGRISVTGKRMSLTAGSGYEYPICGTKGIYQWNVSGRSLAFTKVSDKQCPTRIAVFVGVWKRK